MGLQVLKAIEDDDVSELAKLLRFDPDLNSQELPALPLTNAVSKGRLHAVELLLAGGADPNAIHRECPFPALVLATMAIQKSDPEATAKLIVTLLDAGADPDFKSNAATIGRGDFQDMSAFDVAKLMGYDFLVELFHEYRLKKVKRCKG
jgi:ankyrin repeat protein